MKKKASGTLWGRFTAHGCSQKNGEHFDSYSINPLVTNDETIHTILTLTLMAYWKPQVNDVKGTFIRGRLQDDNKFYARIPKELEKLYSKDEVLLLYGMLYGLKKVTM